MNPNQLGRPPSYTYTQGSGQLGPHPPAAVAGRPTSPLPPQGHGHPPPSQAMNGPPPINTGAAGGYGAPPQGTMGGMAPPPGAHPPVYGGGYGAPPTGGAPPAMGAQYGGRGGAVEVEGAGRSKAQLIVGIDFVSERSMHVEG